MCVCARACVTAFNIWVYCLVIVLSDFSNHFSPCAPLPGPLATLPLPTFNPSSPEHLTLAQHTELPDGEDHIPLGITEPSHSQSHAYSFSHMHGLLWAPEHRAQTRRT